VSFVTRFAPSPTGRLHLGHAFSALTAYRAARAVGGRFLLRIEDTDHTRCRPEFEAGIFEDLAWLGLEWEEPVVRQSARTPVYAAALETLRARDLVYRCFRSRSQTDPAVLSAPHGPTPIVRGGRLAASEEQARLGRGEALAWRLDAAAAWALAGGDLWFEDAAAGRIAVDPAMVGDIILARKDSAFAYHLASVTDDAAQGVTDVIRGEDLREAAHAHRLLQAMLDLPPVRYHHHRLILGPDGRRLAKRDQSQTLKALREAGVSAAEIVQAVGLGDRSAHADQ
jgi:glutamyl-Q tRNA(Asp) synthetase